MANKKYILIFIILSMLFAISVNALTEDFSLFIQNDDLRVCSHDLSTNSIVIKNIGSIESIFSISKSGSASSFVSYSESYFSLKPGESKTITLFIAPGSLRGSYDIKTTVQTAFGLTKSTSQKINVDNCANLNVVVKNPVVNINPCVPAQFNIVVKNTGNFAETYQFSLDRFAEYASISESFVVLAPGESKEIILFINPACEIYGKQKIKFQTLAETTGFLGSVDLTLDIARAYAYDVQVPDNMRFCRFENVAFNVTVENQADVSNVYDFNIKGPSWIKIEHDNLFLAPKTNTVTHLNMTAPEAGNFTVRIDSISRRGDIVKSGERKIIVDDCYVVNLDITKRRDLVVEGESKSYDVVIKNKGTKDDVYSVELVAPEWAKLVPTDFSIKSGKEKSTSIEIDIPKNITGNFKIIAVAKSKYGYGRDELLIDVVSKEEAHKIEIKPQTTRLKLDENKFVVNLKHNGFRQTTYDLKLKSSDGISLTNNEITLNPGEKKSIVIETQQKKEGSYAVELIATPKGESFSYISKFKINIGPSIYEKIWNFLWLYKLYVGIGLAALLILIPLIIFVPKAVARAAEKRRIAQEFKKLKEIEELGQIEKTSIWKNIFVALVILALIGAIVSSFLLVPGMPTIFKTNKTEPESILKIDASGLKIIGNNIIINEIKEFNIPLLIQNNYNENLLFGIEVNVPWILVSADEIEVEAGKSKTINMRVVPTKELEGKDYKVGVSVELKRENKILREAINIKIKKTTIWQEIVKYLNAYWIYISAGAGLVLILIVILLIFGRKKADVPKAHMVEKIIKPKVKLGKK